MNIADLYFLFGLGIGAGAYYTGGLTLLLGSTASYLIGIVARLAIRSHGDA